ncbi:MAG: hypothetical protein NVS4B12_08730 [Ktedonobacteraceae bacterium]
MLSPVQLQHVWSLSDEVLYHEAVVFIRELVRHEDCQPLPTSQVKGLLNIARSSQYSELERYIEHQRERDWNVKSRYLKTFYTELEKLFTTMKNKRLRQEFHLLDDEPTSVDMLRKKNELMAQLAYEFIQHLLAENALLVAERMVVRRTGLRG